MQLNQFTDIGIRSLIYLTQQAGELPFTTGQMAQELRVSRNHLVKVIHFMSSCGWVKACKGRGGGVSLARCPSEYRIGELIRCLEGHTNPTESLVNCSQPVCVLTRYCEFRHHLHEALEKFYQHLNNYTLQDAVKYPSATTRLDLLSWK